MILTQHYLGCLSPGLLPAPVFTVAEISTLRRKVTGVERVVSSSIRSGRAGGIFKAPVPTSGAFT